MTTINLFLLVFWGMLGNFLFFMIVSMSIAEFFLSGFLKNHFTKVHLIIGFILTSLGLFIKNETIVKISFVQLAILLLIYISDLFYEKKDREDTLLLIAESKNREAKYFERLHELDQFTKTIHCYECPHFKQSRYERRCGLARRMWGIKRRCRFPLNFTNAEYLQQQFISKWGGWSWQD